MKITRFSTHRTGLISRTKVKRASIGTGIRRKRERRVPVIPPDQAGFDAFAKRYGAHYARTLKFPWKLNPQGRLEKHGDASVWIQNLLAGGQHATSWAGRTSGDTRTHIVSIARRHPQITAARTAAEDAVRFLTINTEPWLAAHRARWQYRHSTDD